MIVRWIGAFGKAESLEEAFCWELSQRERKVLSAEHIRRGTGSKIHHARVGLLVKNRAVVRRFASDVWSVKRGHALRPTRREGDALSKHREFLVHPDYCAIVVKRGITRKALHACKLVSTLTGLQLLYLSKGGKLHPYKESRDR